MKILLDECCPKALSKLIVGHDVSTVAMMTWNSYKNGKLIEIADKTFDVLVTIDKNLVYQQNLTRIRMAIILLDVVNNRLSTVLEKAPRLNQLLQQNLKNGFHTI